MLHVAFPGQSGVGKALADDAFHRFHAALAIIEAVGRAGVVAELILGKVAVQTMLRAMLADAPHTALKDRERAFSRCILFSLAPELGFCTYIIVQLEQQSGYVENPDTSQLLTNQRHDVKIV